MTTLPDLDLEEFSHPLTRLVAAGNLGEETLRRLWLHYRELRRWSTRIDLVGPSAAVDGLERHYGEGLAALPWLPEAGRNLVDIGSGAGFPGFVLAAARPDLRGTLVEARQKRWAFLAAAARQAGLAVHCLNARVDTPLPDGLPETIHVVTLRALRLPMPVLEALAERMPPGAQLLTWSGGEAHEVPGSFTTGRTLLLAGSHRRLLREYLRR